MIYNKNICLSGPDDRRRPLGGNILLERAKAQIIRTVFDTYVLRYTYLICI